MHKGDYHTDYSKYYDKEYKELDLAFEHIKRLKNETRKAVPESRAAKESHVVVKRKKVVRRSE